MDNVRLQINIPGWSLQKLVDKSVDLSIMLKNAGIDDFEIAEVHSMKAPDSENEDVVSKDETLNLNTYELENKSPFCSTPRLSLLTPVPFPSIEASRISANPARINRWISRLGNTREPLTEIFETETTTSRDPEKSLERAIERTTSIISSNNEPNDVVIENDNEHNASFHSVTSSISCEPERTNILQKTRRNLEKSASCTSGCEEVSRNFDATIKLEDLRAYPSFKLSRTVSTDISKRVYELLTPLQTESPFQHFIQSISDSLDLYSEICSESNGHIDYEKDVIENMEEEDQGANASMDRDVDVESMSVNRVIKPVETTPIFEICCQFPGCSATMNWRPKFGKARLLNHAFRHAEVNLVKCRTCDKQFNNIRQLRSHIKRAHTTEPIPSGLKGLEISDSVLADLWGKCYSASLTSIGIPVTQSKQKRLKRRTIAKMQC